MSASGDEIARRHVDAMGLRFTATEDYASARCCVRNGLLTGFVLAAQAVEKYLKAYALYIDPSTNVRKASHDLVALAALAARLDLGLDLSAHSRTIARLQDRYRERYPDNWKGDATVTSNELADVDALVCFLEDRVPLDHRVKFRSGIFAWLFLSEERDVAIENVPMEYFLKDQNQAIEQHLERWRTERHQALLLKW